MIDHPMTTRGILPVCGLADSRTKRQLLDALLDPDTERCGRTTTQFAELDGVDSSNEPIRRAIRDFVPMGVLTPSNWDKANTPIPHYELADTPVVETLQAMDLERYLVAMTPDSRRKLIKWVLLEADAEHAYSKNEMGKATTVSNRALSEHVDGSDDGCDLVSLGLFETTEGTRSTRFVPNRESEFANRLITLNEAIATVSEYRIENYPEWFDA